MISHNPVVPKPRQQIATSVESRLWLPGMRHLFTNKALRIASSFPGVLLFGCINPCSKVDGAEVQQFSTTNHLQPRRRHGLRERRLPPV